MSLCQGWLPYTYIRVRRRFNNVPVHLNIIDLKQERGFHSTGFIKNFTYIPLPENEIRSSKVRNHEYRIIPNKRPGRF